MLVPINNTSVKNITGEHHVHNMGHINLLGFGLPNQKYYLVNFHNFFDGIIRSKYFAENNTVIDYPNEVITINDITIPCNKYFPLQRMYNHLITINTIKDGDW